MDIIIDANPSPQSNANKKVINVADKSSPLAAELNDFQALWLMNHAVTRWQSLHSAMGTWREKMAKWERMAEDDYSDRQGARDKVNRSSTRDIFGDQNDTLGTVAGFYDFHAAQAKDDIFGTRPWLAATPEGVDDIDLADIMTKHCQWKFNQSDLEPALQDAVKISTWGGTTFVKVRYHEDIDVYRHEVPAAVNVETGEHFRGASGDYVRSAKELAAMGVSDEQKEWKPTVVEDTQIIYANVTGACVDYNDIAFETTAKELDLRYTDVFCRFRMGLLDLMDIYKIPAERKHELMGALFSYSEEARAHRDETTPGQNDLSEENANPLCTLVEGFLRCDPRGTGRPSRIHMVFSPDMHVMFAVNYLGNITPNAILPVFPVRINKLPNRIFGKGYFEKYENYNNAIDRQYNLITYRNRTGAHIYTAFQPEALLKNDGDPEEFVALDPATPFTLAPDKMITDAVQFVAPPENNATGITLLNQTLQMVQMRSGITSAAQGELKGVPSSSTATGTRDLQSRGATIIKDPIDQQIADIRNIVEFAVIVLYANQDKNETFTWGDGRNTKLLTLEADKVQGLRAHVTLTLVQAQNQAKLQSAMTAIDVVTKYFSIPEPDKVSARRAFVQALSAIGFNDAEDIIRKAAVDPAGILALCPPDLAPVVQQAFAAAGLIAPPAVPGQAPGEPAQEPGPPAIQPPIAPDAAPVTPTL